MHLISKNESAMKIIKQLTLSLIVIMCFLSTQCDDDESIVTNCDQNVIVNEDLYNDLETAFFTFVNVEVIDDCLSVEISSSGCDGNSWEFNMVDSGLILESFPEQRNLKFQLINNEACLAVFQRTVTFDLLPLRIEGSNEINLNIDGLGESVTYSY